MTTSNPTGIVAVTDQLSTAGAVTFWALSGACDADELAAVWEAAGLDRSLLPELPSPSMALRRAMHQLQARRRLVRPLDKQHGLALVAERSEAVKDVELGEALQHQEELRATITAVGTIRVHPPTHALAAQLKAAYGTALNQLSHEDISSWLSNLVQRAVHATALRESGGFYFVPPQHLETWRKMVGALTHVTTHKVYEMPAMHSEQAVAAILDAVSREAGAEAKALEQDLNSETTELGKRALATRERRCQAAMQKLTSYEGLLGSALDELKDRLRDLQQQIATAALQAMNDAEDAAS